MKIVISILILVSVAFATTETKKSYYPDGVIKSAITYKNGKKNGAEHIYYPDGAILQYSRNYVLGRLHGLQQEYDRNAMLIKEESYNHGRLDGRSRYYHNGILMREVEYRNGLLDGTYREFFPSGLVRLEIFWKNGRALEGYRYDKSGRRKAIDGQTLQALKSKTVSKPTGE